MRYAIVPSHGCYSSESRVRPLRVMNDPERAKRLANRWTVEHRREMAKHGGTSGGFRVVETTARTRRNVSWRGHELDHEPTV